MVSSSQLKWLSVVDEYTGKCLALKVARGITSEDVIDTLSVLFAMRGVSRHIRSDNSPEFITHAIRRWLGQVGVDAMYIEPGSPWENGCAESIHGRLRDEFLAMEVFDGVRDAGALTVSWSDEYNTQRPHGSLRYLTPSPNPEPGLVRESSCPDRGWKGFSDEEATQYRADRGPASAGGCGPWEGFDRA